MAEGYYGIIDIDAKDIDMPTIMFDSKKTLGKIDCQPRKINNQDYLEARFSTQTGEETWDKLYKKYVG